MTSTPRSEGDFLEGEVGDSEVQLAVGEWRPVFGITIFAAGRAVSLSLRCLPEATACVAYLTTTSLAMFSALTK